MPHVSTLLFHTRPHFYLESRGGGGGVANRAEVLKKETYADLSATHHFVPGVEAKEVYMLEVGHGVDGGVRGTHDK